MAFFLNFFYHQIGPDIEKIPGKMDPPDVVLQPEKNKDADVVELVRTANLRCINERGKRVRKELRFLVVALHWAQKRLRNKVNDRKVARREDLAEIGRRRMQNGRTLREFEAVGER